VTDRHNTKYNTLISEQPYIHARWSIFTFTGQNEPGRLASLTVTSDGGCDRDIEVRLGKANTAFAKLGKIWVSKILSTEVKIRLCESLIQSILLYCAEKWSMKKANEKSLKQLIIDGSERYCLFYGRTWCLMRRLGSLQDNSC